MGQIPLIHEAAELRHRPQLTPPFLRIRTKQGLRDDLASLSPGLVKREHIGGPKLVLALPTALIGIALIVCLAA
jgi:hypothetical protein